MADEVKLQGLSRHVRFFLRASRKNLPRPLYDARVERGMRIPMPDGTYQVADRYVPVSRGVNGGSSGERFPTLLVRCPYGRGFPYDYVYGALFAEQGFHVVLASCRGTAGSTGEFEPFVADGADAQATVAWLRERDWFNGSLGTIGASYLGFTQWVLAADPPPELKAMVIQVSSDNFYNFLYPGGAFALEATLTGVSSMLAQERGFGATAGALLRLLVTYKKVEAAYPLLDGYAPAFGRRVAWLEEWLRRPSAGDPYWETRAARPVIEKCPPVSLLGGWSDVMLDDTLDAYARLRAAGRQARLIIGPWNHSSAHSKDMPIVFTEALGFLRAHLLGDGETPGPTPVRVHVSGVGPKGEWRDLADWPPPQDEKDYQAALRADGTLDFDAPDAGSGEVLRFRYDPSDPTPAVGGPLMDNRGFGPRDNALLEARGDVLTFTGPVLGNAYEVIGPVGLRLRARGSSPHFDVFARLCDVDADGKSWNVCDGLVRLADGGDWTEIQVPMSATAHRFAIGHRLRVQLSGGAHPRFARNTGTAEQIATATSLVPVDIEVRDAAVQLSVSPGGRPPGPPDPGALARPLPSLRFLVPRSLRSVHRPRRPPPPQEVNRANTESGASGVRGDWGWRAGAGSRRSG